MNVAHMAMLLVIASAASAGRDASLSTVLTPDGRIMEGASGSFDPDGFRMTYGSDGEPLFLAEASLSGEPAPFSEGQYDAGTWYPLGSGVNERVLALAVSGTDVYVGGDFTQAGGSPANYIARWDGSSWHALGSGVSSYVRAIAVSGSDVYVGGWFTQAGGSPASSIARWDGSSWHSLGAGVNHIVDAIAVSGSDVYVGGQFTQAGGSPASRIARWDGSSWYPLGSGVGVYSPFVATLAVSGSDLYAGGYFSMAGGASAHSIGRWDGTSWYSLGSGAESGLNDQGRTIAVSGSDLYVGGYFTRAGGITVNYIARWDGSNWHALGSGVGYKVFAIAVSGSDVYVGGEFTEAGGSPANYIARWRDPEVGIDATPEVITGTLHASPNPTASGVELSFRNTGLSPLTLEIYDAAGRLVSAQDLGTLPAGAQSCYWGGLDGNGQALAQGVYFVRLSSSELEASTRVVLLR